MDKSIRQNLLSESALNLIAWAFDCGLQVSDFLPVPVNAIEVMIGEHDVKNLLEGNGKCVMHGLGTGDCYFKHIDDPEWAVVLITDCNGDAEKGRKLIDAMD